MNPLFADVATNPALGVTIFALGGLAGAVFYLPFKKVVNWAWESYWLVYALAGLVVVPWALAFSTSPNTCSVLLHAPKRELAYCFACGAMWGVGGLTWGLMIRYLGVGLGLAIGCGLCSATGRLIPPILAGKINTLYNTFSAQVALGGVLTSILGIVFVGMAGMSKEGELPEAEKKKAVAEYNFQKGILVALFSGIMSAGMSFGLQGGGRIQSLAASTSPATSPTWQGMPVLVVVLLGGFAVNFLWCLFLNAKNRTFGDYVNAQAPRLGNLFFAGLAGLIWCLQFVCFKTGEPAMGPQAYVGWAVLMASAILFSTLLGMLLGEWNGTSGRTRGLLAVGLLLLLASSAITGVSGALKEKTTEPPAASKTA